MVVVPLVGRSMEPLLPAGALLRCAGDLAPSPGDVVLFPGGAGFVAHRLVARRGGPEGGLLLRGDGCRHLDPLLPEELALGVVVQVEVGGRRLNLQDTGARRWGRLLARTGRWGALEAGETRAAGLGVRGAGRLRLLLARLAALLLWRTARR